MEGIWAFDGIVQRSCCGAGLHQGHVSSLHGGALVVALQQSLALVLLTPSPPLLFEKGDVMLHLLLPPQP